MAEFAEVMKAKYTLCSKLWMDCDKCPLSLKNNGVSMDCDKAIMWYPKKFEEIILNWVKEDSKPKYPTWYEFFRGNKHNPIPEAIAKQLRLEPIK